MSTSKYNSPCMYESKNGGCTREFCPYIHQKQKSFINENSKCNKPCKFNEACTRSCCPYIHTKKSSINDNHTGKRQETFVDDVKEEDNKIDDINEEYANDNLFKIVLEEDLKNDFINFEEDLENDLINFESECESQFNILMSAYKRVLHLNELLEGRNIQLQHENEELRNK